MNTGENLEKEVERIYKLLGAKHTERRKLIESYEIDVYATFNTAHIEYKVIVECKEYGREKRVSDIEMRSFSAKLLLAQKKQIAELGVFITTSSFSKNALKTAADHNIKCLTIDDLYNQLVNFEEYTETTIKEFSSSSLSKYYIDQTASQIEDYSSLLKNEFDQVSHYPLSDYLTKIFLEDKTKRVAVLGNFGTGKTSFCHIFRDKLLKEYKKNPRNRIPILISLKDFRSGIDIDQLITSQLQKLPNIDINLQLCKELQRMGRFVFILDGLDEMATKVDRIVINENLREIDRLNTEGDNSYIITCRTHFFQDKISDEFLSDYKVLYLTEWQSSDLKKYLEKRYDKDWEIYYQKISAQLGLKELAKTPIFLDMILNSLSSIEENEEFNIQKLYRAYTNDWIEKQSKRRGSVMTSTQRRKFLLELSSKMYLANSSILHYSELYNISKEISGYIDNTRVDYFDTDARTSTFVTKDSNGYYGFYHRSFMEFFIATQLCDEVNQGVTQLIAQKLLSIEIFEFIFLENLTQTGVDFLKKWSEFFKDKNISQNAVQILLKLNIKVSSSVAGYYNINESNWDNLREAVKTNDTLPISKFIEDNRAKILRFTKTILDRYEFPNYIYDAEDILGEIMIKLWNDASKKEMSFESINTDKYIYNALRKLIHEKSSTGKSNEDLYESSFDKKVTQIYRSYTEPDYDEIDDSQVEKLKQVYLEINKIPREKDREAFLLVYRDGHNISEVAKKLKIKESSLRLILYNIRTRLRRKFTNQIEKS